MDSGTQIITYALTFLAGLGLGVAFTKLVERLQTGWTPC